MTARKKIAIIGGGITGLAAAYELTLQARKADTPIDIELFEQAPAPGGKIVTKKDDPYLVEGGPDCFIVEKPWALQLIKELDLENELLNTSSGASGTFVFDNNALHRLPEGVMMMVPTKPLPFLASKLISWPGKIRMACDIFIPKKKESGDETLAAFVRRRLGQEALDKMAEPLIGGIHAGNPENMSLLSTFPRFLEMEQDGGSLIVGMLKRQKKMVEMMKKRPPAKGPKKTFFISLKQGLGYLVNELAAIIGQDRIHCNRKISQISRTPEGKWLLAEENHAPTIADALIVTTETYAAAAMLENELPRLADLLKATPYVSSATVSMAFPREAIPHPLDAYGFIVPKIANRRIMAVTWSSIKWEHRAPAGKVLLRAFVGGAQRQELAACGDQETIAMVREELSSIMGISSPPEKSWIYRWPQGMPQYIMGHLERLEAMDAIIEQQQGLYLAGAGYRGIGIPDCINQGRLAAGKAWETIL
ncbi:MAG: protoporphyrinogen oxidase [Deltaproteobacteria bacterium]|nr:protoporphyrinogen oxidase [Deltaproteobacteria bacterium]